MEVALGRSLGVWRKKKGGGVLELFEMDWKKEGVARDVSPYMVMF